MMSFSTFFTKEEKKVLESIKKYKNQGSWGFVIKAFNELDIPPSKAKHIREALSTKKIEFLKMVGEALTVGLFEEAELENYINHKGYIKNFLNKKDSIRKKSRYNFLFDGVYF